MTRASGVPAPLFVLASIASVQVGSAVARTLFDDLGPASWCYTSASDSGRSPRWCW
jgi:threonine/homoserine efflux transporter RhtA